MIFCAKKYLLMVCLVLAGLSGFSQIDTLFYFAPPWVTPDHNPKQPIKFHISSFSAPSTTVFFSQPASGIPDTFLVMGPAQLVDLTYWRGAAASATTLGYDSLETRPANVVRTNGVRIRSSSKITVVYDEITITPNNPETFSLKGQNALGKEFICPFQTKWNNKNLGTNDINGDGQTTQPKSQINIIATKPNTTVWITPRCAVVGHAANVTYSVFLPVEGACYTAENVTQVTNVTGQNLSGSIIVSDKPIAVTVADDSVNPGSAAGQTCYDLMGDQIVPVDLVGTDYIVNRGQLNSQTGEAFFVVATQNFTSVKIVGTGTTNVLLNKGDTYTHNLTNDLTYIQANKNVYLLHASGYGCELGEALLPPLNCAGSDSVTFTRNNSDPFFLNVLCKAPAVNNFTLTNGTTTMTLPSAQFTMMPSTSALPGGPFYGAQFGPFSTSVIPANSSNLLFNSAGTSGFFALGIFNGTPTGGTLFHYMSSFLRKTTVKTQSVGTVCSGGSGTISLSGTVEGAAITGIWTTSYFNGTTTIQGGGTGTFSPYSSSVGTISTVYNVSAADTTFGTASTKTITLYLTSTGLCKNVTDSIRFVVYQRPQVSVGQGTIMCKNNVSPIALNGTVTSAVTGVWSGGNAGIFGIPGVVTTYTPSQADINSGLITLSLTSQVPYPGCSNSVKTLTVSFINSPSVSVVPTVTQVCTNSSTLELNGFVGGITNTGLWTGGSGAYLPNNSSPTATYVLSVADLGQSSITLTLTSTNNSLCVAESATMLVNIIAKPVISLPQNLPPVCAATGSVVLSGTISGLSNQGYWSSAGTGSIVQGNQFSTVTATYFLAPNDILTGTVDFSLTSSGGVCPSETSTLQLTVLEPPVVSVDNSFIPVCNNASIALSGTVTGFTNSGVWTASSATSTPGTFTPGATSLNGLYIPSARDIENGFVILTLSSTNNGVCPASSAAFTASFIPSPKADFSAAGRRCLQSPINFSSTSQPNGTSFLKYNWDFGDKGQTSQSTVQSPLKTYQSTGQFVVTLTVTGISELNVECPDVVSRTITIKPLPIASFSAPPACEDLAVTFTNRSTIISGGDPIMIWDYKFGDQDTTNNRITKTNPSSVSHLYKIPGAYVAALTVTAAVPNSDPALGCVSETQYLTVNVLKKPKAEFGMTNNPVVALEPLYFADFSTPPSTLKQWSWDFGDGESSADQAPSHLYQVPGNFKVTLTIVDAAGCIDTISKVLDVSILPQLPAAFSPNGDGHNDILYVKGGPFDKLLFRVYNSWGEMLFESNDASKGWDGKKNGVDQPTGVYVWTIVADMYNNRQVKKNGDITLIR